MQDDSVVSFHTIYNHKKLHLFVKINIERIGLENKTGKPALVEELTAAFQLDISNFLVTS